MSRSLLATRRAATPIVAVFVLVFAGGLAGCGKKGESGTVVSDAGARCAKTVTLTKSKGKPTKVVTPTAPVTKLVVQDLKPGTGAVAVKGKQLTVNYLGIACSSGQQFDTSWGKKGKDKDDPLPFVLGAGAVIKGWDTGLAGMKVGGERRLVIPGSLAYGPTGNPPSIQTDDTLTFVVDLLKVSKAPPPRTTTTTTAPPLTAVPKSGSTTSAPETTTTAAPGSGSATTTTTKP